MTSNDQVRFLEEEDMATCASLLDQGKKEDEFSLRLFQYYYRLFEKRGHSILTLAIADGNNSWHPKNYQKQVLGLPIVLISKLTNYLIIKRVKKS